MLDNNFWGLLESQIEALKNSEDKDTNIVLLETAKLILANINVSPEIMQSYDKFDMRELFALYADVASHATGFFTANKSILDPAALAGSIGEKLSSAYDEIASTKKSLETIELTEKELLEKEDELMSLKKRYEDLSDKVSKLKSIRDTMTLEVLEEMSADIDSYQEEIEKSGKKYERLSMEIKNLSSKLVDINDSLNKVSEDKEQLSCEIIDVINRHYETVKMLFEAYHMDVDKMMASIKDYQATYNRMEEEVSANASLLSEYEAYLGENSKIIESMKKYGVKSLSAVLDDIARIRKTIDDDLAAYDLIMKKIMFHEEEIRKELGRRQGKML